MGESVNSHVAPPADAAPVVARPWGRETARQVHPRARVRHVVLHPGQTTASAAHCHRTEHWTVVQGTGSAWIDGAARRLCENETLSVPAGTGHALENTGRIDLHVVAVEIGSYLGEDDLLEPLPA